MNDPLNSYKTYHDWSESLQNKRINLLRTILIDSFVNYIKQQYKMESVIYDTYVHSEDIIIYGFTELTPILIEMVERRDMLPFRNSSDIIIVVGPSKIDVMVSKYIPKLKLLIELLTDYGKKNETQTDRNAE